MAVRLPDKRTFMSIFIAITLWLLNGQAYLEQKTFKDLAECVSYGQTRVIELLEKDAEVLYGSCYQVAGRNL